MPAGFSERLAAELGAAEAAAVVAALELPPRDGLRVRRKDGPVLSLLERLGWEGEPLPWSPEGALLTGAPGGEQRHPATLHPWQDAGAYYLQDPSAMGVVPVLDPRPGDRILDLAAAPGGKSTYIADRLAGSGLLWSHDLDAGRVDSLVGNLERWGVDNAVVSHGPVERLQPLAGTFDAVLLDAPCSGEGLFRKSASARRLWSPQRVEEFARLQAGLLDAASTLLRPGGVLVYATCTFSVAENEGQVAALLGRRDDLFPEPIDVAGASSGLSVAGAPARLAEACARWWPHLHPGDGHFVARLRRDVDAVPRSPQPSDVLTRARSAKRRHTTGRKGRASPVVLGAPASRVEREALAGFTSDLLGAPWPEEADRELVSHNDQLWSVPRTAELRGVTPRRVGLPLGTVRKGRFEPHHAFSRRLPGDGATARRLDLGLDDPRLAAYLRGETLAAEVADGWLVVRAAGLPLGWAKAKRGELNNRYPRGLRHHSST